MMACPTAQEVIVEHNADLQTKLENMEPAASLNCSDPHCTDPSHSADRDSLMLDILCSVIESSHTVIPLAGGRKGGPSTGKSDMTNGCVPDWKEEVEPFQQDARFWHAL